MKSSFFAITSFVALYSLVNGHGLILAANGANGVDTQGFGVDASTPRDGSGNKPFQQDTSIIRDREIASGRAGPCGRTQLSGNVDVVKEMQTAVSNGLAEASPDGMVSMTVHQVNQDGAGPFNCDIDASGTGNNFVKMNVVQDVPGRDVPIVGSLSRATATDFQLVAQMPAGMTCTGAGGACLVRCRNTAIAGPFGSCVAVTNNGGGGAAAPPAAGNGTASTGGSTNTGNNAPTTPATNTGASTDRNAGGNGNGGGFLSKFLGGLGNNNKKVKRAVQHEKKAQRVHQRRRFAKSI